MDSKSGWFPDNQNVFVFVFWQFLLVSGEFSIMGLNFSPSRHCWSFACPLLCRSEEGGWRKWPGPPLSVSTARERDDVVKQKIASIDLGRNFLPSGETVCTVMCDFRIWNCSVLWKLCCEEKKLYWYKIYSTRRYGGLHPPPLLALAWGALWVPWKMGVIDLNNLWKTFQENPLTFDWSMVVKIWP